MVVGISTLFETRLADHAAALWLLEDEAFVRAALTLLVEEEALADDSMYFVLLLRQGYSKHHVLAAMADRWSNAFRPGKLPGVLWRLRRYRAGCWPIVGGLIRWVLGLPGDSVSERRLRVIENQLYLLAKSVYEFAGAEMIPPAPWGGLHRVVLLQELLDTESRMPPEIRATYEALMRAGYQKLPDESAPKCGY